VGLLLLGEHFVEGHPRRGSLGRPDYHSEGEGIRKGVRFMGMLACAVAKAFSVSGIRFNWI